MMHFIKLNLQIIKKMIQLNKLRYFDVSFRYSRTSWGVLVCLGVSWGNKTDRRSPSIVLVSFRDSGTSRLKTISTPGLLSFCMYFPPVRGAPPYGVRVNVSEKLKLEHYDKEYKH